VNIASITNLQQIQLNISVEYRDLLGNIQNSAKTAIAANRRFDFIVNDLGLKPNTYGTVCIETDAIADGAWTGGVAIYKPDTRNSIPAFGDKFDYVLNYPFANPKTGATTFPLNTYHLGTDPASAVANWISMSDARPGDGQGVNGTLVYFNEAGLVSGSNDVRLPDGGRLDFSGHEGIGGPKNKDAIGLVQFVPSRPDTEYYMTVTRYFYDCPGASCSNFLTAFAIPDRPATAAAVSGGVSTVDGEISIVELNNVTKNSATAKVTLNAEDGTNLGSPQIALPKMGTQHIIVNKVGSTGFLANDSRASATVTVNSGFVSALSLFYKLDTKGKLVYGYAAPLAGSPGAVQLTVFNTFINQQNNLELYNSSNESIQGAVDFIDYTGRNVFNTPATIPAHGTYHLNNAVTSLTVPKDLYGTIIVQASKPGIVARNFVSRVNEYKIVYPSAPVIAGNLILTGISRSSATLQWTSSVDPKLVKLYQLIREDVEASSQTTISVPAGGDQVTTSYTDTGLVPGTRYTYTLRTLGQFGTLVPDSNEVGVSTIDFIPTLSITKTAGQGITISITPNNSSESLTYEGCRGVLGSATFCTPIPSDLIGPSATGARSFKDTLPTIPGTIYTYQFEAIDAQGNVSTSTKRVVVGVFSDDPIPASPLQARTIKANHITELRSAITALSHAAGFANPAFTETVGPGTVIKASHFTELRARLQAALTALDRLLPEYHNPDLAPGSVASAADVEDLRQAMQYVE